MYKCEKTLYSLANIVIKCFGIAIFLFLVWNAFFSSQYLNPLAHGQEFPVNVPDSRSKNLLCVVLAALFVFALYKLEEKKDEKFNKRLRAAFLAISVIWVGALSFWWIFNTDCVPSADQGTICRSASDFMEGNYYYLGFGQYCERFPQQLGLVAILELLFRIFGKDNYFAYEVINAALVPLTVIAGYGIVRKVTKRTCAAVFYCITMMFNLPFVFYTSWVYGEVASIFFYTLSVWMLLCYSESEKTRYLVFMVLSLSVSMLTRKNTEILIAAICLTGLFYILKKPDKKLVLGLILAVVIPNLALLGVRGMYSVRSGIPMTGGVQNSSFIAMGLIEADGRFGWDNNYQVRVEFDNGREGSEEVYRRDIRERLEYFRDNPSYGVHFFVQKQLSQWNEPIYQGLYFGGGGKDDTGAIVYKLRTDEYFVKILHICDRLQMIVFVGMLLYFIFAVKKDGSILEHTLPVLVIGGFLFTMMWEAKARYVLPYYVVMFPMAGVGYLKAVESLNKLKREG